VTVKTVRVKLEYTRRVTQTERGTAVVEVPVTATVGDAYQEGYKKNFIEYLPKSYEVHDEDWDFVMEPQTHAESS
jgi:hypothetical protein